MNSRKSMREVAEAILLAHEAGKIALTRRFGSRKPAGSPPGALPLDPACAAAWKSFVRVAFGTGVGVFVAGGAPPFSAKSHTVSVPLEPLIRAPRLLSTLTDFCSDRNEMLETSVISPPPGGVTNTEYVRAGTFTTSRKW